MVKLFTIRNHSGLIIRAGLALVFLANSYTAFVSPDEFSELIGKSFLASLYRLVLTGLSSLSG